MTTRETFQIKNEVGQVEAEIVALTDNIGHKAGVTRLAIGKIGDGASSTMILSAEKPPNAPISVGFRLTQASALRLAELAIGMFEVPESVPGTSSSSGAPAVAPAVVDMMPVPLGDLVVDPIRALTIPGTGMLVRARDSLGIWGNRDVAHLELYSLRAWLWHMKGGSLVRLVEFLLAHSSSTSGVLGEESEIGKDGAS